MDHRKGDLSLKEYLNILRQWLSFAHHFIVEQEPKVWLTAAIVVPLFLTGFLSVGRYLYPFAHQISGALILLYLPMALCSFIGRWI